MADDDPNEILLQGRSGGCAYLKQGFPATWGVFIWLVPFAQSGSAQVSQLAHSVTPRFWTASATGSVLLTPGWTIEDGDWTIVIMNADTSTGVTAQLTFGAAPPSDVDSIGRIMLAVGLAAFLGGGLMLLFVLRGFKPLQNGNHHRPAKMKMKSPRIWPRPHVDVPRQGWVAPATNRASDLRPAIC